MKKIQIDNLTDTVMKEINEYKKITADNLKREVRKTGNKIKNEIQKNAPVKSGAYKKSWKVKTLNERVNSLNLVVHSSNRYQLSHLLEFGHALRNGGRSKANPHIKLAEELGIKEFEENIKRIIENG